MVNQPAVALPDHRRVEALLDRRPDRERGREVVAAHDHVGAVADADLVDPVEQLVGRVAGEDVGQARLDAHAAQGQQTLRLPLRRPWRTGRRPASRPSRRGGGRGAAATATSPCRGRSTPAAQAGVEDRHDEAGVGRVEDGVGAGGRRWPPRRRGGVGRVDARPPPAADHRDGRPCAGPASTIEVGQGHRLEERPSRRDRRERRPDTTSTDDQDPHRRRLNAGAAIAREPRRRASSPARPPVILRRRRGGRGLPQHLVVTSRRNGGLDPARQRVRSTQVLERLHVVDRAREVVRADPQRGADRQRGRDPSGWRPAPCRGLASADGTSSHVTHPVDRRGAERVRLGVRRIRGAGSDRSTPAPGRSRAASAPCATGRRALAQLGPELGDLRPALGHRRVEQPVGDLPVEAHALHVSSSDAGGFSEYSVSSSGWAPGEVAGVLLHRRPGTRRRRGRSGRAPPPGRRCVGRRRLARPDQRPPLVGQRVGVRRVGRRGSCRSRRRPRRLLRTGRWHSASRSRIEPAEPVISVPSAPGAQPIGPAAPRRSDATATTVSTDSAIRRRRPRRLGASTNASRCSSIARSTSAARACTRRAGPRSRRRSRSPASCSASRSSRDAAGSRARPRAGPARRDRVASGSASRSSRGRRSARRHAPPARHRLAVRRSRSTTSPPRRRHVDGEPEPDRPPPRPRPPGPPTPARRSRCPTGVSSTSLPVAVGEVVRISSSVLPGAHLRADLGAHLRWRAGPASWRPTRPTHCRHFIWAAMANSRSSEAPVGRTRCRRRATSSTTTRRQRRPGPATARRELSLTSTPRSACAMIGVDLRRLDPAVELRRPPCRRARPGTTRAA